ncbi:outer membrane lipoprotein chaperone LolA [Thiomicrorhabdus aquaedulcis]|uniref:outer membrane lipoprotein chaperone LolA n=1 Tax=Thiomicrorhabdus aquaedulcis TaxID=2211106 RepID=UPI000FD6F2A3|nr:outer membrane lipoprotein chaperone LolA [Thiomicrorhabdus aquaedulcis]
MQTKKPLFSSLKTSLFNGLFAVLGGVMLSVSLSAWAGTEHELQNYVNQLKTFEADFEQVQPDEARFELNQSFGHFQLNRPGQLVWQYSKPNAQKIVVDEQNLWVYDLDLDQVSVRPIEDVKAEIPLSWLLYDEAIEKRFTIIDAGSRNGMSWYNLAPKQATYFQSIEIGLKNGEMTEVWMYQNADNVTKVKFKNIQSNQVIPLTNFQFKLPAGTDLVGEPQ